MKLDLNGKYLQGGTMDDLQFYLVNDYCPRCNSVTPHDAFEVDNKQHKDEAQVEQVCEKCQGLEL